MKSYEYRGRRIRPGDKYLVSRFFAVWLSVAFWGVFLLSQGKNLAPLDIRKISSVDWKGYFLSPRFISGICLATTASVLLAVLYCRLFPDALQRQQHRQKLARMILSNGWYESETVQDDGFIKGLPSPRKEKITWFPRMYYRMDKGRLYISVEVNMGRFQEQLSKLEKKLESGLYCELTDRELCRDFRGTYIRYVLLYDMIANRINIAEVKVENGRLRLMKNIWWEYDSLPHMLICGGTGGGKTYFILTIIEALLRTDAILYVLDPKNADLADLAAVMPNVYFKKEEMVSCLEDFYEKMMERSEEMKKIPGYQTGNNYAALGLPAHFLIFDEYVAFMEMLGRKENESVLSNLKQIVMLGRQAGFFLVLACQRPDAKYLGDGIRDQFNFRVALGRNSELGYNMMFGETNKEYFLKQIKGRGYVDCGKSVVSEFYTPLVPKGYDFLKEIGKLQQQRNECKPAVAGEKEENNELCESG